MPQFDKIHYNKDTSEEFISYINIDYKRKRNLEIMHCDDCIYYIFDDEDETWYCTVNMDEDEYARLMQGHSRGCPYYRNDDEYQVVRHQM